LKKSLVIVESPAKAKTISKFLGKGYKVVASYGHVRDLPSSAGEVPEKFRGQPWSRMAVDTENEFKPVYVVPKRSAKYVKELKKQLKEVDELILATDEDREGESISWHLLEVLKPKVPVHRIAFHEITKSAIQEALENSRAVDKKLVRAQESRRILDRLYGYSLSPVLWKKVRTKLSAGRVQSVAVRLVVEREEERLAFKNAEYWDVQAQLQGEGKNFSATLVSVGDKRIPSGKDFDPSTGRPKTVGVVVLNEQEAVGIAKASEQNLPWNVARVEKKQQRRRPAAPFITSTLQQAASSQLGMSPGRTMRIAQQLYEGIDLGGGDREGLITYMRTDSVILSEKALSAAGAVIRSRFGDKYYHGPRRYKTKSKAAQEAHEAIRPTELSRTPAQLKAFLAKEELALYNLIWRRTLASQMADALIEKTSVDFVATIDGMPHVFRANGSIIQFDGFLKVIGDGEETVLPDIQEGQKVGSAESPGIAHPSLLLLGTKPNRHETSPPARYTEASLVKKLEEEGIGRPSTYAPTISTIQQRGYVVKRKGALVPTFVGMAVVGMLRRHFAQYVDLKFTANMEEALDDIASGNQEWVEFLKTFYNGNGQADKGLIERIKEELPKIDYPSIPVGEDPVTGEPLTVRIGSSSAFIQRGEGGPENTATIPHDVFIDDLNGELAREIIENKGKGKVELGEDKETGEPIFALEGPYGPYVQLGEGDKKKKPKRCGLPKGMTLEEVNLELARKLLSLPRVLGEHPETGKPVKAGIGRFGPFVQHEKDFRSIKEEGGVFTIDLDGALALLAQPKRGRGGGGRKKKPLKVLGKHPTTGLELGLYDGRYGPYISDGKVNGKIPKDTDPESITLERAVELMDAARAKKKS